MSSSGRMRPGSRLGGTGMRGQTPAIDEEASENLATDEVSRRSVPLFAMLAAEPFPSRVGPGTLLEARNRCIAWRRLSSGRRVLVWTPPPRTLARFCRVQLGRPGGGFLHLAQVRVVGRRSILPPRMPVVDVACGKDSTIAITAFRRDPAGLEELYRRSVAADPANAEVLQLLPGYAAAHAKLGSDYRDAKTRLREETARRPPSPRAMRRQRTREIEKRQRERQARRAATATAAADDASKLARGRMAKQEARRQARGATATATGGGAGSTDDAVDATVAALPDAEGPDQWREQAVSAARALLEEEDCMKPPEASSCPNCFRGHRCAACRFHAKWVVPFASRQYGRALVDRQRVEMEVAERRQAALDRAATGSADVDVVLMELEAQLKEEEAEAQSSADGRIGPASDAKARVPAYRQWPLRDVIEAVLTEDRSAAGEASDDSDLDEVPRPIAVDSRRAEARATRAQRRLAKKG